MLRVPTAQGNPGKCQNEKDPVREFGNVAKALGKQGILCV